MSEDISGSDTTKIIYKSAETGEIVSKEFADENPGTTVSMEVPESNDSAGEVTSEGEE
jgi:hypothetical protein